MPTDNVQLTFWWWGSQARAETTQKVIDLFEEQYPFIDIVGEPQDFANYFANLATKFAAGDAPDVITMGGSFVLGYAAEGNLLDLGTVTSELDSGVFPSSILTASTFEDKVYGVPTGANSVAVLANPQVFEAAGVELPDDDSWTWDDFVDIANEISANSPDGTYGAELRSYDFIGAYAGQRTPLYDAEGNLTVTADTLEDMWAMEQDLLEGGGMPPADLTQERMTVSPEQTLFGQGRAAMFFGYTNQLGTYATAAGNEAGQDDDMVLLRLPGETEFSSPGMTLLPSQYYTVNVDTPHQRQAALFVNFLVNSTEAGELILADRGLPSSPAVRDHITPLLDPYGQTVAKFLSDNNDNFGPSFLPPSWATDVNAITQSIDSQVLFGQLSPADAAAEWIKQMQDSKEANS